MIKKHAGGRPLKFKTVKEMQDKINSYFDFCDNRTREIMDKKGNTVTITVPAPYTMSGLANALDTTRETISCYKEKDEFTDTIMRARAKVQEDIEIRLMETRNEKGAIFNLINNFGWKQKQETDITSKGDQILVMPSELINKYDISSDTKGSSK